MRKAIQALAVCCVGMATSLAAQTNTFPASGNVGIGTTNTSICSLNAQETMRTGPDCTSASSILRN
jgi:hypothetical protein